MIHRPKLMRCTSGIILAISTLLLSCGASAQVLEMSADLFAQQDADTAYWEVTVTCDSNIQSNRVIRQDVDGLHWCAKQFPDVCHEQKQQAAEMVCANSIDETLQMAELERQRIAQRKRQDEQRKRELARQQREAEQRRLAAEKEQEQIARLEAETAKRKQAEQQQTRQSQATLASLSKRSSPEQIKARLDLEQKLLEIEQKLLENQRQVLSVRQRAQAIEKQLSFR